MTNAATTRLPGTVTLIAALGVAWNLFGVYQWWGQFRARPAVLMGKGMTAEQAVLYASLPGWMASVFAIGVFGGLAGSLMLIARRSMALGILAVSLAGYLALFAGDIALGVFAAFGAPQVTVLTIVVAIAISLLALAAYAGRRGLLR